MKTFAAWATAFALFFAGNLHAQVPQLINYQGRVVVGTANFNGAGSFKFALVNATGTTTYWSNDGTSTAGSQPTNAVTLTVTKGLYSVLLGDISLVNMTAIPVSVFQNTDVRVRVWFNDGVNGSQLLAPDQRIAAVGYAIIAGNVPDGAITSAKIAPGAVSATQIANGAITTTQLAAGAVQGVNIAAGAVGAAQIAPGTVGFNSLAKPPQSGTVNSVALSFDFGQASFAITFPQPFAAVPVVTLALAASGNTFPLEASAHLISSSATQFTGRFSAFSSLPITVQSADTVGRWTSLLVVQGNPAICYYDANNSALTYVRATDILGTVWGAPVVADNTGAVGEHTSMALVFNTPAISYYDILNSALKYVRATEINGATWGTPVTIDSAVGASGQWTSLVVVNGNPAISYYGHNSLKFVRSTDPAGANWDPPVIVDSVALNVGEHTSLAIVSGNPAISYRDRTNGDLKYVRATNASGTAWGTPLVIDSTDDVGFNTSLQVVDGHPAISYHDDTNGDLKYVRATDPSGTAWGMPLVLDSVGNVGSQSSLAVIFGRPAISYYAAAVNDLKYVRASDASGTAWGTPITLDSGGSVGFHSSLAEVNGHPAISYHDTTNGDLKFVRQSSPNPPTPFQINWIALPP